MGTYLLIHFGWLDYTVIFLYAGPHVELPYYSVYHDFGLRSLQVGPLSRVLTVFAPMALFCKMVTMEAGNG